MCEALVWSLDAVTTLPWLELMKTAAAVATAIIASLALKNWQRQDNAKRRAEFLDQLTDATHTYIAEMSKPIALVELINIGMKSHAPTWEGDDQLVNGGIAYIDTRGLEHSKRLLAILESIQPSTIRLRSLVAKGQVFKFEGYTKCQNAVTKLTWQFDRIEGLAAFIGSSPLEWESTECISLLKKLMVINADNIRKGLMEENVAVIEFVTKIYGRIYD